MSSFLEGILKEYPGQMMPLAQVYCYYNRARGTCMTIAHSKGCPISDSLLALISPDDLYRASVLMESLDLPVQLREFSSGVRALHPKGLSDEAFCSRIANSLEDGPLTATLLADQLNISITLAKEQLLVRPSRLRMEDL